MKVILVGVTGFVGRECLRLALRNPNVTSIVALARREMELTEDTSAEDRSKFTSIVMKDMGQEYPLDVKEKLKGADACIWNLAITPNKSSNIPWEEITRVCHDFTMIGLKTMAEIANQAHPFQFIYTSGAKSERDQSKSLWVMSDHRKMRGEVESAIVDYASKSNGKVQVQITKPGLIKSADKPAIIQRTVLQWTVGLPHVFVSEIAAIEVDQAVKGLEKEVLENADLVSMGQEALKGYVSK